MIELATHLEEKAAKLKCKGLGKIKTALAGCNTSSLIDMLEGAFGSIDLETISLVSIPETKGVVICGPETQSHYRCQFMDCTQIFLQKAAACTHVCCDHLNVALACLYCSHRENPKMQWFSASAWEKNVRKHSQDGLPLFPDNPAFTQLSPETLPSTSGSTSESLPLEVILERAKAAKQCLEEESKASISLKCRVKQGPIKKCKKQRDK